MWLEIILIIVGVVFLLFVILVIASYVDHSDDLACGVLLNLGGLPVKLDIPNPGSEEAVRQGCVCPVMDNHHGKGMPYPEGLRFWMNEDCPLHGSSKADATTEVEK